jgi:MSHA biogenesis protein MshQ
MRLGVLGGIALLLSACGFSGAGAPGDADIPDPLIDGTLVDGEVVDSLLIDAAPDGLVVVPDSVFMIDAAIDAAPVAPAWAFRRRLRIDNAGQGALMNFPLGVHLNAQRFSYANAQSNGADLRFGNAAGQFYPYEIERWNPNGTSLAWVKVPTIAATTTTYLYVYYGNPTASDAQDRASVWSDYVGVWHLDSAADASTHNQSANSGATFLDAKVGRGANFSGSNQYIDTGNAEHLTTFTIEVWIRPDTQPVMGGARAIVSRFPNYMLLWGCDSAAFCRTAAFNGTDPGTHATPFAQSTTGVWSHVVARRDQNGLRTWVNGADSSTLPETDVPVSTNLTAKIGARPDATGFFDGQIDELRISRTSRSPDYIRAHFKSTGDTYLTYGSEEPNPNP